MSEYFLSANESLYKVFQIEHIDSVNNIESILEVEGIDCLFIGPYDLAASMGHMGEPDHKEVLMAIEKVRLAVEKSACALGIFTTDPGAVRSFADQGYTIIAQGMDSLFLQSAISSGLKRI